MAIFATKIEAAAPAETAKSTHTSAKNIYKHTNWMFGDACAKWRERKSCCYDGFWGPSYLFYTILSVKCAGIHL